MPLQRILVLSGRPASERERYIDLQDFNSPVPGYGSGSSGYVPTLEIYRDAGYEYWAESYLVWRRFLVLDCDAMVSGAAQAESYELQIRVFVLI